MKPRGVWGGREGITPHIKVHGDVPQVWVAFSHLLVFIRVPSIVLGYHLPVVCICYGNKMRMNGIFGSEFKPAYNGVNAAWFPSCINNVFI